jgi:CheY-like chemotaxis protein
MKLANILLVEDCDADALLFADFFENQRICNRITRAKTYQEAFLQLQRGERFDLCVVDLLIPGNGGLAWIERAKATPGYHDVPMIVMSGVEAEHDVKEACRLGVLAFIVKPLSPEKWWPVIQELKKLHIGLMVHAA